MINHPRSSLVLLILALAACAKVADPLPPIVQMPDTIRDLRITQAGNTVRLLFALPSSDIELVEVYRQCNPAAPADRFEVLAAVYEDELNESDQPGLFIYADQTQLNKTNCRYAVRFLDRRGQRSDLSNVVRVSSTE